MLCPVSGQDVAKTLLAIHHPFLVGGFYYLGRFLFALFGRICLEINSRTFRLQRCFFGFRRQVSGPTADIDSVEVVKLHSVFKVQGELPRSVCGLTEGGNTHIFEEMLTAIEKDWLVAEIAHFLKLPHKSRRRLA